MNAKLKRRESARYITALRTIKNYEKINGKIDYNIPKFVKMVSNVNERGSELRYVEEDGTYFRDAGIWEVGFKFVDGVLLSSIDGIYGEEFIHMENNLLIEISEEEWREGNDGYVSHLYKNGKLTDEADEDDEANLPF